MALVNNATTIGTGGKNLVLETAGHIYIKVNERYYELDFKNSGSEKLYGKPVVNEIIQPTEEVDLSDYITNEDLKKALKKYVTEKSWQDVIDTQSALQNSLLDFEEAIKPITVQTMQVVVGSEELQFDWIYDFTHTKQLDNSTVDSPLYIDMDESSEHYNQLVWNPGYVKHYTIDGPSKVMPETSPDDRLGDYWRWYIMNSEGKNELEEIYMDGTFYVYLKVPYSDGYSRNVEDLEGKGLYGANLYLNENGAPQQMLGSGKYAKTGIGQVVYSSEAIKFGPEYDDVTGLNYYYLLYAIVTDSDGSPNISTLNGFTEILPGQIRAYIFATSDGTQYLDFLHERFKIGNESEFLSWDKGQLNIKGNISVTGGDLKNELIDLQSQINNEIQCWFSTDGDGNSYDIPLPNKDDKNATPNWPVSNWENPIEHIGDLYYIIDDNPNTAEINEKGQVYRYIKDGNLYYWTKVLDNSVSLELYNIYLAKEAANNAINKFAEWANDGVINSVEISNIESEYKFIINDYKEQSKKAILFKLENKEKWINYDNAYTAYKKNLEDILDWWEKIKNTDQNTETYNIPSDFQNNLEEYYNTRIEFMKLVLSSSMIDISYITEAIKKGRTDINGGLVMTGLIELGFGLTNPDDENYYNSYRVMSGINGILKQENGIYNYKDPAVWFGGEMLDRENDNDLLKPGVSSLFIKENNTDYNKYINNNTSLDVTFYKWIKNDEPDPYYSASLSDNIFIKNLVLVEQLYESKYTFNWEVPSTLVNEIFEDSERETQSIGGDIIAYNIGSMDLDGESVINISTGEVEEIVRESWDVCLVKTHNSGSYTINLVGKTILMQNTDEIIFMWKNQYYRIAANSSTNHKPGVLYINNSIIDVYSQNGTESLTLNEWSCNDKKVYTITDYDTEPNYVYLISGSGTPEIANNYTVVDYSVNLAKSLFRMDGSGYLADGNISWNDKGNITMKNILVESGDIGPLHISTKDPDSTSVQVLSDGLPILDITNKSIFINGRLETRSKWEDNAAITVSDPLNTQIFSVSAKSIATNDIATYVRRATNASLIYGKGSVMGGKVIIPNNAYYSILEPQYIPAAAIYEVTKFGLEYNIDRVRKAIKGHIYAIPIDNVTGALLTKRGEELFSWTWGNGDHKGTYDINSLTKTKFTIPGTSGLGGMRWGLYLYLESGGYVKSGVASNSKINILATTNNEAKITRSTEDPIPGTFIGSNGISSIFGKNTKFQWIVPNAEGLSYGDTDPRNTGGIFYVEIPFDKDQSQTVGLRIIGYNGADGKPQTSKGVQLSIDGNWHNIEFDEKGFLRWKN